MLVAHLKVSVWRSPHRGCDLLQLFPPRFEQSIVSWAKVNECWLLCSLINNQLLTDARTPRIKSCAWLLALYVLEEVKKWFFNNSSTVNTSRKRKMNIHKKAWKCEERAIITRRKKYSCRHPLTRKPWQWMNGCSQQRIGKWEIGEEKKKSKRNFCKLRNKISFHLIFKFE